MFALVSGSVTPAVAQSFFVFYFFSFIIGMNFAGSPHVLVLEKLQVWHL